MMPIPNHYKASFVNMIHFNRELDILEDIERNKIRIDDDYMMNEDDPSGLYPRNQPLIPQRTMYRGSNTPEKFKKPFIIFREIKRNKLGEPEKKKKKKSKKEKGDLDDFHAEKLEDIVANLNKSSNSK